MEFLLTFMSFQTHNTFVHPQNTNDDIFNKTWDPSIESPCNQNFSIKKDFITIFKNVLKKIKKIKLFHLSGLIQIQWRDMITLFDEKLI